MHTFFHLNTDTTESLGRFICLAFTSWCFIYTSRSDGGMAERAVYALRSCLPRFTPPPPSFLFFTAVLLFLLWCACTRCTRKKASVVCVYIHSSRSRFVSFVACTTGRRRKRVRTFPLRRLFDLQSPCSGATMSMTSFLAPLPLSSSFSSPLWDYYSAVLHPYATLPFPLSVASPDHGGLNWERE